MNWLERYLEYTKDFESPTSFHFWSGVSAISSVLGRKVWTRTGTQYQYPNTYIVLVSPSAVARKSTAMDMAMKLVDKAGKHNIVRDKMTDAALWKYLAQLTTDQGHSTALWHVDELSTAFSADNQWSKDLIATLTRFYVGADKITKHLVGDGMMEIDNLCLSLLAGTTPADLMSIFPKVTTGMGFSGRCLFIFEEKARFRNPHPKLQLDFEKDLVLDLRNFAALKGEIPLSPMAAQYYDEWYMKQPEIFATDVNSSFAARKHVHVIHLGLILAVAKKEAEISRVTLGEAFSYLDHIEKNLKHTLERVGMNPALQDVEVLKELLRRCGGRASRGQIGKFRKLDKYQLRDAIDMLKEQNLLTTEFRATGKAGKPAEILILQEEE